MFVWLYLFRTCFPWLCWTAPSFLQLYLARQSVLQAVLLFCSFNCTIYHLHSCTCPGHCLYGSICLGHVFHSCVGLWHHSYGYIWPGNQSCEQSYYSMALIAQYITYIVVHAQGIACMALFVHDMFSVARFPWLYLARQSALQAVLLSHGFNLTIYHIHSCTHPGHCLYGSIYLAHVYCSCVGPQYHSCSHIWPCNGSSK